jgi:hypothetical protein
MDSRSEHVYDNEHMKVLIYTHPFAPMVGGIESYTMLLARRFSEVAQTDTETVEVTVVTQAQARDMDDLVLPLQVESFDFPR